MVLEHVGIRIEPGTQMGAFAKAMARGLSTVLARASGMLGYG